MTEKKAVVASSLTKRFGDVLAVDGFDLEVAAGTVVALLGPNGAGKTTIVRMLATLLAPSAGRASVCGFDIVAEADAVRRAVSLTGQFAALEANLTSEENLVLMARLHGYHRPAARRVAESLIDRFDIGEFREKLVKSLSGGQRRRVDLAASLVTTPQVLVLDEPTTGLDPRSRQAVWSTVRQLTREGGVTILLTTQYLEEADELAETVVLMDHGRTVAVGSPAQLKARIGDHRVDVVVSDGEGYLILERLLAAHFSLTGDPERHTLSIPAPRQALDLQAVTEIVAASGIALDEVALRRPTLDDAFLALTSDAPVGDGRKEEMLV